jgi:hypothetical protein
VGSGSGRKGDRHIGPRLAVDRRCCLVVTDPIVLEVQRIFLIPDPAIPCDIEGVHLSGD